MKKKSATYKLAYYDETGRRRGKTFSAPTAREARLKAAEWELNRPRQTGPAMTVLRAVEQYIDLKRPVWSPSTTRSFLSMKRSRFENDPIGSLDVFAITSADVQGWISRMAAGRFELKTIRNAYGLLLPAVRMFRPETAFTVTFPQRKKTIRTSPSSADVQALLAYVRATNGPGSDLEVAIMLAAACTLRRGEICALSAEDLNGSQLHVCKCMVFDEDGEWVVKAPKTVESDRTITIPKAVVKLLKGRKGRIVDLTPNALTMQFDRAVAASGVPKMRFHDLRHYSVSVLHAKGVPDVYLLHRGGWSTPHVLKSVYLNEIASERQKQDKKIASYFDSIL